MILEAIADRKYLGWASLASMCREWQHVSEVNFHKIKLRVSCLDGFRHIAIPPKRGVIRHICLVVQNDAHHQQRPALSSLMGHGTFFLSSIPGEQQITWHWRPMHTLLATTNIGSRTCTCLPMILRMTITQL
ncbi:hypothetical protein F4803DRAFT_496338 [Xylaria telfairii]|nr:hypothetical protein F4803DRAFT_496338 [Xylaria telfairii]